MARIEARIEACRAVTMVSHIEASRRRIEAPHRGAANPHRGSGIEAAALIARCCIGVVMHMKECFFVFVALACRGHPCFMCYVSFVYILCYRFVCFFVVAYGCHF